MRCAWSSSVLTLHLPEKYGVSLIECVLLLTILTGLIQLSFGLLRLGGIVRYVSNSVVVGFTAGAGILIAANQLKNLLGLNLSGEHIEGFFMVLAVTLRHLPETNPHALILGVVTAAVVIILPRINPRLPGALIGGGACRCIRLRPGLARTGSRREEDQYCPRY